ncbi:Hypothetical predicted protein [Cloeon dipterum]|uniref:C2H2-type domain-containing protein n=1 Tax=Cloeon dipterum TaxID=197152 RepID=A0A8S1CXS5_9INSE|nr:Hypothetical predicted protein [Cloeon dipterum]
MKFKRHLFLQSDTFKRKYFEMKMNDDAEDTFICGRCKQEFHEYDSFKDHKITTCRSQFSLSLPREETPEKSGPSDKEQTQKYLTDEQTKCLGEVIGYEAVDAADVLATQFFSLSPNKQPIIEVTVTTTVEDHDEFLEPGCLKIVEKPCDDSSKLEINNHLTKQKSIPSKKAKGEKSYVCEIEGCNFEFLYHKDLVRHVRTHTKETPFTCGICDRAFSRADKLQLHTRRHKNIKPYACDVCDYTGATSSNLKSHQMIHSNSRPWKCQVCPYRARGSSQLAVHLRRHTGDLPFRCTFPGCKSQFKTGSNLRRHQNIHSSTKPFTCNFCTHCCNLKSNLISHMRKVHLKADKRIRCKRCEPADCYRAANFEDLLQHNLKVHQEDLLLCEKSDCQAYFFKKSGLDEHIKKKHSTEKKPSLSCSLCKFVCSKESILAKHKATKHAAHDRLKEVESVNKLERKHQCSVCEATFVREDSLRAHSKTHQCQESGLVHAAPSGSQLQIQDLICIIPNQAAADADPTFQN